MKSAKVVMRAEMTLSVGNVVRFEVPSGYATDSVEWRKFCRKHDGKNAVVLDVLPEKIGDTTGNIGIKVRFFEDNDAVLCTLDNWFVFVREKA